MAAALAAHGRCVGRRQWRRRWRKEGGAEERVMQQQRQRRRKQQQPRPRPSQCPCWWEGASSAAARRGGTHRPQSRHQGQDQLRPPCRCATARAQSAPRSFCPWFRVQGSGFKVQQGLCSRVQEFRVSRAQSAPRSFWPSTTAVSVREWSRQAASKAKEQTNKGGERRGCCRVWMWSVRSLAERRFPCRRREVEAGARWGESLRGGG